MTRTWRYTVQTGAYGLAVSAVLLSSPQGVEGLQPFKGVAYAPVPCKGPCYLQQDDFMSDAARPFWGSPRGRGDLEVMRLLGANVVRTYGNNPENDHRGFLDEAARRGLSVIVGNSDYRFIQSADNCLTTGFNCYHQIKESYLLNLKNGFLAGNGSYHPALRQVVVINEPDLKLPGIGEPALFSRGVISSIDAMLDAEKDMNVTGSLVNFTVAFSFAICSACRDLGWLPGLGQMASLRSAMLDPQSVGYRARNDLAAFYRTRFVNGFNTANPARDIKPMFLDRYEVDFGSVPVSILEFHKPGFPAKEDLQEILQLATEHPLLQGVSFFEFHSRHDKGGTEEAFGMFALGDFAHSTLDFYGGNYSVWCLVPRVEASVAMPKAVAAAFQGSGLDYATLCLPDPEQVHLDEEGFAQIARQRNAERMEAFIARVLRHLGGTAREVAGLKELSKKYAGGEGTPRQYRSLIGELLRRPPWTSWLDHAPCVADREATPGTVGNLISWACGNMKFDCAKLPAECKTSVWTTADYVFGMYYVEHGGIPLESCSFGGSAILLGHDRPHDLNAACVVAPHKSTKGGS